MSAGNGDGNTSIRKFILNLTKKIKNCDSKEELKKLIKLRETYFEINKNKIDFVLLEKQINITSGDLFWEFCGQSNFIRFSGFKNLKFKKFNKITYNYESLAGDLITYYF